MSGEETYDPDACLGDDGRACYIEEWLAYIHPSIHPYILHSINPVDYKKEGKTIPSTKFHAIGLPSCWLASPALPRRGSSSAVPCVAGFSSGMPVADAMILIKSGE